MPTACLLVCRFKCGATAPSLALTWSLPHSADTSMTSKDKGKAVAEAESAAHQVGALLLLAGMLAVVTAVHCCGIAVAGWQM